VSKDTSFLHADRRSPGRINRPGLAKKGGGKPLKSNIAGQIASTGWIMADKNMRTTNSQTNRGLLRRMRRFRLVRVVTMGLILPRRACRHLFL